MAVVKRLLVLHHSTVCTFWSFVIIERIPRFWKIITRVTDDAQLAELARLAHKVQLFSFRCYWWSLLMNSNGNITCNAVHAWTIFFLKINPNEPSHGKTNKTACTPSEDSDQPGHPPSLIRVFAVGMKKAWVLSYTLSALRRLWPDWADAKADLSLRWVHMPFFFWFCHEVA